MTRDFRIKFDIPEENDPPDAMSGLPPVIDLKGYVPPPKVEPARFTVTPQQMMWAMERTGGAIVLPPCSCPKRPPPEAMHTDACNDGAQYRLMQSGQIITLWARSPGEPVHGGEWHTPKDCYVRTWQVHDPRQYVYEITDPWAAAELYEAPPAWEYA